MSLLSICQTVAREAGVDVPAAIIGNNDDIAAMLLALANRTGRNLRWRAWSILQAEATLLTVAGNETYQVPDDLLYVLSDTMWDRTNYWKARGSLSPMEWQAYKSGIVQVVARRRFRLKGRFIYLFPTPTANDDEFVYEYVTKSWVVDDPASPTPTRRDGFQADADVSLIDEDLISLGVLYRFLERKGFSYLETKDEFIRLVDSTFGREVPHPILDLGNLRGDQYYPPLPLVPITGYTG